MKKLTQLGYALVLSLVLACAFGAHISAQTPALTPPPPSINHAPKGAFDGAWCDEKEITLAGWSYDEDTPSASNDVHFYYMGESGLVFLTSGYTNSYRDDVNGPLGISGYHGFVLKAPRLLGKHNVYAYGIDTHPDHANNTLLPGWPKEITCKASPIKGRVLSASSGRAIKGAAIGLYEIDDLGVRVPKNWTETDVDGNYAFDQDYYGAPLKNHSLHQVHASSNEFLVDRTVLYYDATQGTSVNQWLARAPLTATLNGSSPTIASENGQLQIPVKVCNYSYADMDMDGKPRPYARAKVSLSGPGQYSDWTMPPTQVWWFDAPRIGQCNLVTFFLQVDSRLPDGLQYNGTVTVGSTDQGDTEEYSKVTASAYKGVANFSNAQKAGGGQ